jgi:dipeptidyl aminopeptidase/acylaminoacyl peptidase
MEGAIRGAVGARALTRRRWGRRAAAIVVAVVLLGGAGGAAAGVSKINGVYDGNTIIDTGWCHWFPKFATSTPASFPTGFPTKDGDTNPYPLVDVTPFLMPKYETVQFPSRDTGVTIAAWWIQGASADSPAVIFVHGRGKCRQDPEVLLPAGMLHRHGYSALVIDLRNHGDSTVTDGRQSFGVKESQDILGAWDWLRQEKKLPEARIGIYGASLGAGSSIIATGKEPRVAALWEDSTWASFHFSIEDEAPRQGIPAPLVPLAVWATETLHPVSDSPISEVAKIVGRPFAMVQGTADQTADPRSAGRIHDAFEAAGGSVEPWILDGVQHVRAAFVATAEYERRLIEFFDSALGVSRLTGLAR